MPASNSAPSDNEILKDIDCVEQDDDDEVYPQIQAAETTEFFFCHQSEFQRHLLYRFDFILELKNFLIYDHILFRYLEEVYMQNFNLFKILISFNIVNI